MCIPWDVHASVEKMEIFLRGSTAQKHLVSNDRCAVMHYVKDRQYAIWCTFLRCFGLLGVGQSGFAASYCTTIFTAVPTSTLSLYYNY